MLAQKINQMKGQPIIVTTAANNRIQGKIVEVAEDYIVLSQEGAPKARLVPLAAIDNLDYQPPQQPRPPQDQPQDQGRRRRLAGVYWIEKHRSQPGLCFFPVGRGAVTIAVRGSRCASGAGRTIIVA